MGEEEINKVADFEEGEISDSASVEEISEEDFNKQEVKAESAKAKSEARVWTMQDLYKYQYKQGYTSGLYNLAWAQAVQNKPLNVFDLDADQVDNLNSNSNRNSSALSSNSKDSKTNNAAVLNEGDRVVIDVEKEEGELEEGEIDLDWEPGANVSGHGEEEEDSVQLRELKLRKALESIISSNSAISFDGQCSRLQHSLEDLRELVVENRVPSRDSLVKLFIAAMQSLHSVFNSMDHLKKESNNEIWRRMLSRVVQDSSSFLPSEQLKEMEDMVRSLDCPSDSSITSASSNEMAGSSPTPTGYSVNNLSNSSNTAALDSLKQGIRNRGILIPLLDLHKDHDVDSLPSPTRQAPPALTLPRALNIADGMFKPEPGANRLANGLEEFRMHPYETEVLKTLSSYQQKFSRTSSFTTDRLPSPTPSEDGACGADDVSGEVSSSTTCNSNPPILGRSVSAPLSSGGTVSMQGVSSARSVPISSGPNLPAKLLPKSRDPRLRFVNADAGSLDVTQPASSLMQNSPKIEPLSKNMSSRKPRLIENPTIDGPEPKRPRTEWGNPGTTVNARTSSVTSGPSEGAAAPGWQPMNRGQSMGIANDPRTSESKMNFLMNNNDKVNVAASTADPLRVPSTSAAPSWPELLMGIAVNPTMLMNLIKMGQQHMFSAENTPKSTNGPSISSPVCSVAPPVSSASMASGIMQRPAGAPQAPAPIIPNDDTGKIRMKPRDPRRILHENTLQRSGSLGSEQLTSGIPTSRPQVEVLADKKVATSQPVVLPDITQQFTKNLKNVADIMSTSQALPVIPPNHASQPMQASSGVDVKTAGSNKPELQTGNGPVLHTAASVPTSQAQNTWGDVEHLFEGYDDQQKAAIQRERARRIEEQKKMFSAHKLCLVLDLDHTLLNSAKFVEVEPVHDEVLRKKEEQDREKPQRHLFRFPHMGMWTKLRPGIWNFLEKASKLYELHLYTMGNKLYATEMAKVLDPKGVLFAGRVISRGDDGDSVDSDDRYKTKDLEGVLGMESAVVIIDDSVRVWPHNKLNLIVVERYTYFPSSRRQFGLLGPSLLEIDHDERPEDGTLASSLSVIERIHQIFFSHQSLDDVDVRNILATEQRKILSGCKIVFSRVFPVGEANPHLHPLWQTAEQFGAECANHIDDKVTHVVANSLGTDKVNWALSTGRFVVHPGWVEASALLYRRANEQDFAIKP